MNVAVRYQSRGGHVKAMAESLAEGAGVEAISVDDPRAPLDDHVDLLFIGGAMYKWKLDPTMDEFLDNIAEGSVYKAVVFGSSLTTRRPVYSIQEKLRAKGTDINPLALFQRGRPKKYLFEIAPPFARDQVKAVEEELAEKAGELEEQAALAADAAEQSAAAAAARAASAADAAEAVAARAEAEVQNDARGDEAPAAVDAAAVEDVVAPSAADAGQGAASDAPASSDALAEQAAAAAAEAERLQALAAEAAERAAKLAEEAKAAAVLDGVVDEAAPTDE